MRMEQSKFPHGAVFVAALSVFVTTTLVGHAVEAISFNVARNAAYWLNPNEVAGVVPVPFWNENTQLDITQPKFYNVTNSLGAATECDVNFGTQLNYSYSNNTPTNSPATNDQLMMKSMMGTSSTSSHYLGVTSVPYERYDVYVYFGGPGSDATTPYNFNACCQEPDGAGGWVTVTPTYWIRDSNKQWSGSFKLATATTDTDLVDGGENYMRFEGLTNSSVRIYIASITRRGGPSGFQIVDNPPTPTVTVLMLK